MKIAHLIDTLDWGGAQKLLVDFAASAIPHGIEVLVIVLRRSEDQSPYIHLIENTGAQVKFLAISRLYDLPALPPLIALLREENIDVLHTHLSHANILGGILGRIAGIPVVATLHNVWSPLTRGPYTRSLLERLVLRLLMKKLIAVGHVVAKTYRDFFTQNKLLTIPNPVNKVVELSELERKELRREITGDAFQVIALSVGRLLPRKGYAELISAFSSIQSQHPNAVLAIAGDYGMGVEFYQEQVRSLGLDSSVRLLGFRKDASALMAVCDVYINSSHWEGLSIAMLEAMSVGVPVLATSVGDAPYLLADGRGVLVPPGDTVILARELSRLLEDHETRRVLGEKGRAYVQQYHSVQAWVDALLEVYTNVMSKPS